MLRFHWRLVQGGEASGVTRAQQLLRRETALPDLAAQIDFCRQAEAAGIDSVLVDLHFSKPEPIMLATALSTATTKVNFMLAVRSGLLSPTLFVQQINTFSALAQGRVSLNIVAGHSPHEQRYYGDWLAHDERYRRTAEFLTISHAFWRRDGAVDFRGKYFAVEGGRLNTPFVSNERNMRTGPEVYIAGNSPAARDLATACGSCWMRLGDAPEKLKDSIQPVLDAGKEVGLRLSVITRSTRAAAVQAASALVAEAAPLAQARAGEKGFMQHSDSVSIRETFALAEAEWLTPYLWAGAVRSHGAPALALVGTREEVARGIMEFKHVGVSQFILSGWPKQDEMLRFGQEVLPLIRKWEQADRARGCPPEPTHAASSSLSPEPLPPRTVGQASI